MVLNQWLLSSEISNANWKPFSVQSSPEYVILMMIIRCTTCKWWRWKRRYIHWCGSTYLRWITYGWVYIKYVSSGKSGYVARFGFRRKLRRKRKWKEEKNEKTSNHEVRFAETSFYGNSLLIKIVICMNLYFYEFTLVKLKCRVNCVSLELIKQTLRCSVGHLADVISLLQNI